MNEQRGAPARGQNKAKPKRSPARTTSGSWWPYAIAVGVVVLVAGFVAITKFGDAGTGKAGVNGGGLLAGSAIPTDSVPSSSGGVVSLTDFRGSKVVVYFFEGGG